MRKYLFVIVTACLLSGCQPDCASSEVQETILQIAKEHSNLNWILGVGRLKDIRTTDKNGAGVLSCAANFEEVSGVTILYKVEQTSDGKIYVSITRIVY
jgi:trehalose-6-phosphate synthase